jgi:hypothetical protein
LKKEIYIKVVLIEKIRNEYHLSNIEVVKKNWRKGRHPEQCKGNCELQGGFMMTHCKSCGWVDL